jgi:two-component system, sensor histidine kinase YesM
MHNPFKTIRINKLIVGGFGALIVILLMLILGISYRFSANELVESTSYQQKRFLVATSQQIDLQIKSIERMSLSAAQNIELNALLNSKIDTYERHAETERLTNYLGGIVNGAGELHSIDLYIPTDLFARHAQVRYYSFEQLKSQEWYPVIQQADYAWIGEHTELLHNEEQRVISFARNIFAPRGGVQAVMVINMKVNAMQSIMRGGDENAVRSLYDTGARLLTRVGSSQDNLADFVRNLPSDSGYDRSEHKDTLLVWSRDPSTGWALVEETPLRQVVAGSTRLFHILLVVAFAAILAASLGTVLLSRQFVKPVSLLVKAMLHYQPRVSHPNLPTDYQNEFGRLFRGFHDMASRIDELYLSLEEEHSRKTAAEIKALQAMINPHFLYNTLDQVNWMAVKAGQLQISEVLEHTGRMLRIGLSNGESLIPIREEIEMLECYLAIQNIKWSGRLKTKIDIDETLTDAYVPKLTIQPFVENAVLHGFHGKNEGCIKVEMHQESNDLIITITDNGNGLKPDWNRKSTGKKGGYGLRNVRERIDYLFGDAYGFVLQEHEGGGTRAELRLPLIDKEYTVRNRREQHVENRIG